LEVIFFARSPIHLNIRSFWDYHGSRTPPPSTTTEETYEIAKQESKKSIPDLLSVDQLVLAITKPENPPFRYFGPKALGRVRRHIPTETTSRTTTGTQCRPSHTANTRKFPHQSSPSIACLKPNLKNSTNNWMKCSLPNLTIRPLVHQCYLFGRRMEVS
jgi:hypothetical protein